MDHGPVDSSGTDDDLPPTVHNMGTRGGVTTNGRTSVKGGLLHSRENGDMETQIHCLETEAYSSVLRAFKAQSDAITWEKEGLITELRKELRVSDDEHRELLNMVNADDVIQRIREWRQTGRVQSSMLSNVQAAHDMIPSPTLSASRKKQKTSQSIHSLGVSASLQAQAVAVPMQPFSSAARQGALPVAASGKKFKPGQNLSRVASKKSTGYLSTGLTGRGPVANQDFCGLFTGAEPAKDSFFDSLIGRKVKTRWPEDNNFYEAVIAEFNPVEGRHALVYDRGTKEETWEWVDLKEISPDDIQWEGEDPGISCWMGREVPGSGIKRSMVQGDTLPGAGRGALKDLPKKDFPMLQNGNGKNRSDDIQILHTDTLIKEIEEFISSGQLDLFAIEKAKKALKDHEQSLINAISSLAAIYDGESEEGYHQISHEHSMDPGRGWINR